MEPPRRARWIYGWGVGYLTLMAVVVWALLSARRETLAEMAMPGSLQDWTTWRDDVGRQREMSVPVERQVPKSAEPPMLVLLRDHFGVMMAGAIIFSTLLYVVLAWLITGVLTSKVKLPARGAPDKPITK